MLPAIPFLIIAAAFTGIGAWLARPKTTGFVRSQMAGDLGISTSSVPTRKYLPGAVPPLSPESQSLLALLVLFARDKKNPPGEKRYLSYNTAKEAVALARHLGLHKTARAIQTDDAVPTDEYLPGRTVSVRESVVSYGTTGKA